MGVFLSSPIGASFPMAIGPNYNTFTARQDVSPRGAGIGELPVAQGGMPFMGMKLKVEAEGEYSTTGTPTLVLGLYIGTQAAAITTVLAECLAITTPSGAAAFPWQLSWKGTFVLTGTSGSVVGTGWLKYGTTLSAFTTVPIPITQALRTIVWDTTIARAIGVCATWSASSVSNNVRTYSLDAQVLNGP